MKKALLSLFLILLVSGTLFAASDELVTNTKPVAVLTSTPNQTWFYNMEDVVFSSSSSYDPDQGDYIINTQYYVNGASIGTFSGTSSVTRCFALNGSPSGDCIELSAGATSVTVGVRVKDNHGTWSNTVSKTYTIQQHKGRKYFITDHIGNVRATVNRSGNVLGYDDYYPFGLTMPGRSSNSANPNDNYKYIGEEFDDEAGLSIYNLNARTYDPVTARFMQIDPLFDHPNQVGLSPYNYSWNNPINLSDPTGLCPSCPDEEYAPLADHIYSAQVGDVSDNGWEVVRIDENSETGFRGGVYTKTIDGKAEYIYATEGTTPTSMKDWSNNIDQVLDGTSLQYSESVGLAEGLAGEFEGISFTGHSLGGGLASANALAVGGKAVTFNAAGLSDATKSSLGIAGNSANISAYVVQGEILDFSQSAIGLRAEGNINMLPATYAPSIPGVGIDNVVRLSQRIKNHSMSVVRKKMGN
jgi:RHS repeat-associated protein